MSATTKTKLSAVKAVKAFKAFSFLAPAVFIALVVMSVAVGSYGIWQLNRGVWQLPLYWQVFPWLSIHLYSAALVTAILVAIIVLSRLKRGVLELVGIDVWDAAVYVILPAIVGARLYHVITDFQLYRSDVWQIFAIWNGGLGVIGAMIGGCLGIWWYCRRHQIDWFLVVNLVAVVMPLAQAIGRVGNLFNHELFGLPTDLPWGEYVAAGLRPAAYTASTYFHPLFLYEAIANLVLFAVLVWMWRRQRRHILWTYLAVYGIIRFCLDFLRISGNSGVGGFTYTQWLVIGYWLCLIAVMIRKWANGRSAYSV